MAGCKPQAEPAGSTKKVKIHIDPVTRIEGHLKAEVEVKGGVVVDAHITGGMYRGFEQILREETPGMPPRSPRESAAYAPRPMPRHPLWPWMMHLVLN